MQPTSTLASVLKKHQLQFHETIMFNAEKEKLVHINLSETNASLGEDIFMNADALGDYIQSYLETNNAHIAIGGYNEQRNLYKRGAIFSAANAFDEPRTLHLGVDVWCPAGTPIFAFAGGMVHSFAFNNNVGDYGATLILLHQLEGEAFYSLFGHISLKDISHIKEGDYVVRGQQIAHVGHFNENGNWPPHLHFQVISDMEFKKGDYPGVCRPSDKNYYLQNCPDADIVLQLLKYA